MPPIVVARYKFVRGVNTAHIENTASDESSIVASVFVTAEIYLPRCYLVTGIFWLHFSDFQPLCYSAIRNGSFVMKYPVSNNKINFCILIRMEHDDKN
jgi:hypothetical protein